MHKKMLLSKPDVHTMKYAVWHHINIEVDENYRISIFENKYVQSWITNISRVKLIQCMSITTIIFESDYCWSNAAPDIPKAVFDQYQ